MQQVSEPLVCSLVLGHWLEVLKTLGQHNSQELSISKKERLAMTASIFFS